ncbi:AAA family ATPase [Roseofilum sp. BLCC_M91]|uniref:AAA family ATPase n=1 Tax=Roseofilum halophilum BLCC-M91 TaxID=3022259 RepID=A0ABT7BQ07_9CYAN|nr:AAA family ATPase [Roseofilum halophilum]MDJ1180802.1 AAA family ATPase [Roseofilum halophilum BLCC-M91]
MLRSVKIENFRGLQSLELPDLGRLNLLVGANNCGKTSILEAIQLLCSKNNLEPIRDSMIRRGEYFFEQPNQSLDFDIRHLFYSHLIDPNIEFKISGLNNDICETVIATIILDPDRFKYSTKFRDRTFEYINPDADIFDELSLVITWRTGEIRKDWEKEKYFDNFRFPLSVDETIPDNLIVKFTRYSKSHKKTEGRTNFIESSSLTSEKMIELFNNIVLTSEEQPVHQALQTIEPKFKRIAVSSQFTRFSQSREGFLVRLSDRDRPVPIGSLGDGIWRMLGLALAIVNTRDGFLFIDEIDTGLHYTAMADMWKLVWETAKRLNVQVFATTHSSDCWRSLATIASEVDTPEEGIRIHRIERDKPQSIVFTEKEMAIAATQDIEVR